MSKRSVDKQDREIGEILRLVSARAAGPDEHLITRYRFMAQALQVAMQIISRSGYGSTYLPVWSTSMLLLVIRKGTPLRPMVLSHIFVPDTGPSIYKARHCPNAEVLQEEPSNSIFLLGPVVALRRHPTPPPSLTPFAAICDFTTHALKIVKNPHGTPVPLPSILLCPGAFPGTATQDFSVQISACDGGLRYSRRCRWW